MEKLHSETTDEDTYLERTRKERKTNEAVDELVRRGAEKLLCGVLLWNLERVYGI